MAFRCNVVVGLRWKPVVDPGCTAPSKHGSFQVLGPNSTNWIGDRHSLQIVRWGKRRREPDRRLMGGLLNAWIMCWRAGRFVVSKVARTPGSLTLRTQPTPFMEGGIAANDDETGIAAH